MAVILAFCVFFFQGCKHEIEINAPWKPIPVIYGLLDPSNGTTTGNSDSAQLIRIQKAYTNGDMNAYDVAQFEDSLYFDSLDVKLIEVRNWADFATTPLTKVYRKNKDTGIFASPGIYLFQTPKGFTLNKNSTYRIEVKDIESGHIAKANTTIVGNITPEYPTSNTTVNFTKTLPTPFSFFTGVNAKFYDLTVKVPFEERRTLDDSLIRKDTLIWPIFRYLKISDLAGSQRISYPIPGLEFFKFMTNHFEENKSIYRTIPGKKLVVEISGGGKELYDYIQVYQPSIGVVQKLTDYTNVENGYGIFSSRNMYRILVSLNQKTYDVLMTDDLTKNLNFR